MKPLLATVVILFGSISLITPAFSVWAGSAPHDPLVTHAPLFVSERGPHHKTWRRISQFKDAVGRVHTRTNVAYIELATGMHYLEAGAWKESKAEIVPGPSGASAPFGVHKCSFANNIAAPGAISLTMADEKRLVFNVLGLTYHDTASGRTVVISDVKSSIGKISGAQVIYSGAMTGLEADIVYTYSPAGLEQDIVLRQEPPSPAFFGLSPQTTRLQVFTEFISPPEPGRRVRPLGPDFYDEELDFLKLRLIQGKAFAVGADEKDKILTGKQWLKIDGRTILVEEVPYAKVLKELQNLPPPEGASLQPRSQKRLASAERRLPVINPVDSAPAPMLVASAPVKKPGYVLDFIALNNSYTNLTLWANSTYKIGQSGVFVSGTLTIQGGTVVKISPGTNYYMALTAENVICETAPHQPAILTVDTDDSIGEDVTPGDQTPAGIQAGGIACTNGLSGIHFRYLRNGAVFNTSNLAITNCQFFECQTGVALDAYSPVMVTAHNLLISRGYEGFNLKSSGTLTINAEHLTIDYCPVGIRNDAPSTLVTIKNSLFTGLSLPLYGPYTYVGPDEATWVRLSSNYGVYATAGAGKYYLPTNSPYLNAGTTNIAGNIRGKTTQAPVILSNVTYTTALTLSPRAARDTDIPDIGYHYAPIDYITASLNVTNAPLTIAPGTAIAHFNQGGIWLQEGAALQCEGTPTDHNKFFTYRLVQEQPVKLGLFGVSMGFPLSSYRASPAAANIRFTDFLCLTGDTYSFLIDDGWQMSPAVIRDCHFVGSPMMWIQPFNELSVSMDNNIFDQVGFTAIFNPDLSMCNNLFRLSNLYFEQWGNTPWRIKDNLFESCGIYYDPTTMMAADFTHNAYYLTTPPIPLTTNDVALTTLTYTNGPLGKFYYATTDLVDKGSRTPSEAGLYNHTTSPDGTPDTGLVEIGFHYLALDSGQKPLDRNLDGAGDYLFDWDGDGLPDAWEIRFFGSTTAESGVGDPDGDGITNLIELVRGSNPTRSGYVPDTTGGLIEVFTPTMPLSPAE